MKEIKKSNVPYWGNEQNPFQVNEMDDTISRINSIDTSIAEINSLPLTWKPKHEWSVIPIDPIMEKSLEIATKEMFRETEKRLDSEIRNLKNERKTDMNKSGVEYANKLKRFLKNKEYDKDVLKLLGVIATRSSRKHTSLDSEIKNAIVELECSLSGSKWLVEQAKMIGKGIH